VDYFSQLELRSPSLQGSPINETPNHARPEDGVLIIHENEIQKPLLDLKINGLETNCLWDTGYCVSVTSLRLIQELGCTHQIDTNNRKDPKSASGHGLTTAGSIELEITTFGNTAALEVDVLVVMPNNYDMILGWPDTRKMVSAKNNQERKHAKQAIQFTIDDRTIDGKLVDTKNDHQINLSLLETPCQQLFPQDTQKIPPVYCPKHSKTCASSHIKGFCGEEFSSKFEANNHKSSCSDPNKNNDQQTTSTCRCSKEFRVKSDWKSHVNECWGKLTTQPMTCNEQNCFFSTLMFRDMIEHSRRHQIWEAFQTKSVAEILSFSA
jgi:hypothetical protein